MPVTSQSYLKLATHTCNQPLMSVTSHSYASRLECAGHKSPAVVCLSLPRVVSVRRSELFAATTALSVLRDAHCAVCRSFMSFVKDIRAISSGPIALTLRPSVPAVTESFNKRF